MERHASGAPLAPVEPSRPREVQHRQEAAPVPGDRSLEAWQNRLLPFMVWMVGGLTVFFLLATLYQLHTLQGRVEAPPELDLSAALAPLEGSATSPTERLVFAQWQTLANLEKHALERRYHQANVLLMSRTWTRYLGFMTGMILSLVGSAFILGKLREEVSTLGLENEGIKASLETTSPGLVLCVLGTVLMLAALMTHNDIETQDSPLYTGVQVATGSVPGVAPAPGPASRLKGEGMGEAVEADPLEGLELPLLSEVPAPADATR